MNEVIAAHLAALEATLALTGALLTELRHALQSVPSAKPAPPVLPERCAGIPTERCALQSDEARLGVATFADPHASRCVGCGHQSAVM